MAFLLDYLEDPPAPRINRIHINPIEEYRDIEFKKRYRLPKQSGRKLIERGFKGPLHQDPQSRTISAILTVSVPYILVCISVMKLFTRCPTISSFVEDSLIPSAVLSGLLVGY